MNQSQNLCLICCYSFQEKRSRFISNDARDSFKKFCGELGLCLGDEEDGGKKPRKDKHGLLDLPYGENITVCGDCLSLVVLYVQQRTIQSGKEEKLLELQKAVCAALKDLREVVEDVQSHIDQLHSTVRMGDESCLDSFAKMTSFANKENNPRMFRAKILKLSTGIIKAKNVVEKDGQQFPINIKLEPRDDENTGVFIHDDNDDGHFDDSFFPPDDGVGDEPSFEDDTFHVPVVERVDRRNIARSRRGRKRAAATRADYREDFPPSPDDVVDNSPDFDAEGFANSDDDAGAASNSEGEDKFKLQRSKLKRGRGRPPKNLKTERINIGSNIQELEVASNQAASQWKDDLIGRIVMQMNNDIHQVSDTSQRPEASSSTSTNANNETFDDAVNTLVTNSFQFVDGKLKLRGIIVNIREQHRALQCTRCGKKYFEKRDVTGEDVQLETLMRDHILSKHCVKVKKTSLPEIEVLAYTSTTKSKITYKLACNRKYSYTRRATNFKSGAEYFRCDYRLENCGATILHKDGMYFKMSKGWNADGSHTIHAPDVERTERQIEVGRAKAMFLNNETKSIDDVCDDILNQSNGQLMTPLERLKRRMLYAKYQTTGLPLEEKIKRSFPCPHCDAIYKEKRNLTRHIKTRHGTETPSTSASEPQSSSSKPPSARKCRTLLKKAKRPKAEVKPIVEEVPEAPPPAVPTNGPSIVFSDPSIASNFVNKCITAIMQQVGLSVSGNNTNQTRSVVPISEHQHHHASTSASPAPSDASQQDGPHIPQISHGPHHSRVGSATFGGGALNSGQWQQPPSAPHGGHAGFSGNQNPSGNNNQQMHPWPWTLH